MNFLFCSSQKIMQPFHSWRLYSFARKVTVAHAMLVGKQFPRHWQGTVFLKHLVRPLNGGCPLEIWVRSGFLIFSASSNKKIRCWNVMGQCHGSSGQALQAPEEPNPYWPSECQRHNWRKWGISALERDKKFKVSGIAEHSILVKFML